jgi:hypothetical protein
VILTASTPQRKVLEPTVSTQYPAESLAHQSSLLLHRSMGECEDTRVDLQYLQYQLLNHS